MGRTIWNRLAAGLLVSACLVFLSTGTLFGQGTAGTVTGVVSDPSGAVVPGAVVALLNQATGVDFHQETNPAGVYSFTALLPGEYTLTVSAKGFKTYVNKDLGLTVNQVLRIDSVLEVGSESQTITVESAAPLVNTEEGRMSAVVSGTQIENMPLNGRNIYELMQLVPGAINATGVNLENADSGGLSTNVNGTRLNFNGFLLDGVANKGLTGGSNAQPSPDFVQEFRIMTNNIPAEFGNAAGSVTDVSIKSGSNSFHGDAWEYFRNDKLNSRNFFDGSQKQLWRQNQFGFDIGGPIKKDRLFFFGGYEGERFRTEVPAQYTVETAQFRQAVQTAMPNSVAALLFKDFPAPTPDSGVSTVDEYLSGHVPRYYAIDLGEFYGADAGGNDAGSLTTYNMAYTDPCFLATYNGVGTSAFSGGPNWGNPQTAANSLAALLGVTAAEQTQIQNNINTVDGCAGLTAPAVQAGSLPGSAPMFGLVNAKYATRNTGVFYNGDQWTARLDYQGDKTRIFGRFFYSNNKDPNGNTLSSVIRGFTVPIERGYPSGAFSIVRSFTPTIVNEFRFGYTRNLFTAIPDSAQFGVPQVSFDGGEANFGAYNGYPQFFIENIYQYSDMVSIVKGKHNMKMGGEVRFNQENSEFDVGRPSYYFFDMLYYTVDLPYYQAAGVNPELASGGLGHLDTNIRGWRNHELGFFFQDDWKIHKNLTLNFGLRWDYDSPHTEKYGTVTNFLQPPEGLGAVNCGAIVDGSCAYPAGDTNTPNGGFIGADRLNPPDKNNFAPRFGFSWDPFGTGRTAIRGGFAITYETNIFNSLSNSRWNLPYYSFNLTMPIYGYPGLPVYGPTNADGTPNTSATPTYGGAPDNPGQGPAGLGFQGNIMGWYPTSPNLAYLTGIADPSGLRNPYMESAFFGIQHELSPTTVLEVNWVGTFGKKLFWAENPNRVVNGYARSSLIDPCTGTDYSDGAGGVTTALLNPCFGAMRTWKNSVTSNYNAMQVSLNRKMSRGLAFLTSYSWSHAIDFRSDWHALTSGGSADWLNSYGSSGYSLDPNAIFLERGNSNFDIRQRLSASIVWELPFLKDQHGVVGKVLGGWQTNYNISLQSGFPFTVGTKQDLNQDGTPSDRPNIPSFGNHYSFTNEQFLSGSGANGGSFMTDLFTSATELANMTNVAPGQNGNLGRNTFFGPGIATVDFSLFKKIPITEKVRMEFRSEFFNLFNRVNLYPPQARLDNSSFGLSQQAFDPRVIQFGLRMTF
ncbi:MAG: carboxypeptidase regulatory-like domain-containing protein [Terriglobia bacterium]